MKTPNIMVSCCVEHKSGKDPLVEIAISRDGEYEVDGLSVPEAIELYNLLGMALASGQEMTNREGGRL